MFRAAISQTTTSRWELPAEIDRACEHGFDRLSLWRPKLSNVGAAAAARMLRATGVQPSSLQWAGGFTGGDGRSFAESVADALEAIDVAAEVGAPVVVVHGGCRGGHTLAHARRLLLQALDTIAPAAAGAGVILALKPLHPAAVRSSLVRTPGEALEIIETAGHASLRLALDLWHVAEDADLPGLLPAVAPATAVVQVADRAGPPTAELDRLPTGRGTLPLAGIAALLVEHGYAGDFEFDPVGESVEECGYDGVLADTRRTADAWLEGLAVPGCVPAGGRPLLSRLAGQFRPAGSRRSHASSQTVSPG
jgi:sugar phosphate isomerase/epimerase